MKLISLLVLAAFLLFGCASGPSVSEVKTDKEKPAIEKTVTEEVKKESVKIVTTVYYPVEVTSYFGDGVKDEYTVYTYSDDGTQLLKEELFNSDDTLEQYFVSEYPSTDSRILSEYNAEGGLLSYEKNILDMNGNILKQEKFDNKDILQSVSEYEYDNGLKSIWKVFDESRNLLSTTVYSYNDANLIKIDSLSPSGELEEYFELVYDDNGQLVDNNHYGSDGKIKDSRSFEYKDGFLVMELVKRKNGSVLRKVLYNNDQFGNPVETVFMDAGDNVQERLVTQYNSREEISYEK